MSNGQRVVVEKPFGHDLQSARELAADLHRYLDESQIYRIDHFLGKMGLEEILYLRFANTMLEPVWNRNYLACVQITMAEDFGVEDRGQLLRSRRRAPGRGRQPPPAAARDGRDGARRAAAIPTRSRTPRQAVFRAMPDADPSHYVRGQYDGYRDTDGVAPDSTTETYAALRLEIDNWRWAGVPFFIRTGKHLAVRETELRLLFKHPPRVHFIYPGHRRPAPNQIVFKIDPSTGIRLILDAQRADKPGANEIELEVEFSEEGGEGATPYEVLLHAALCGDATHFTRQDNVEECWRIVQPLLDSPPPCTHTRRARGDPSRRTSWSPATAAGTVRGCPRVGR